MSLQDAKTYFRNYPGKLFLLDGCGALLSGFLLGAVLVQLEEHFGMPQDVLYILALPICVFAVYSFSCYFFKPRNWKRFLRFIAIANILYCVMTLSLVIYFFEELTALGVLYFIGEITVVVSLSSFELKVANQ